MRHPFRDIPTILHFATNTTDGVKGISLVDIEVWYDFDIKFGKRIKKRFFRTNSFLLVWNRIQQGVCVSIKCATTVGSSCSLGKRSSLGGQFSTT